MGLVRSAISWIIVGFILASLLLASYLAAMEVLGGWRLVYYLVGFIGILMGLRGLVRQWQSFTGEGVPLLLVALMSQKISLVGIMFALSAAGANELLPALPDTPSWLILGLLGSACMSFFVVGLVLDFAGRHRMMSMIVRPGPFAIFTKRRR